MGSWEVGHSPAPLLCHFLALRVWTRPSPWVVLGGKAHAAATTPVKALGGGEKKGTAPTGSSPVSYARVWSPVAAPRTLRPMYPIKKTHTNGESHARGSTHERPPLRGRTNRDGQARSGTHTTEKQQVTPVACCRRRQTTGSLPNRAKRVQVSGAMP